MHDFSPRSHAVWRAIAPVAIGILLALAPLPAGLAPHAWRFFALFAAVILALILQPLPGGAIGVIGVTLGIVFAPWVLFSPQQLAAPGFRPANAALSWALSGFADGTVWLIFGAYMFALGYEKTGLGRRIAFVSLSRKPRTAADPPQNDPDHTYSLLINAWLLGRPNAHRIFYTHSASPSYAPALARAH